MLVCDRCGASINAGSRYCAQCGVFDNPTLRAMRALDDSPVMRAIRAIEDSPVARMMRDLENSPAFRLVQEMENSPAMKAIREIKESPVTRMLRDLDKSPTWKEIRGIEETSAFMAIRQLQESAAVKVIRALERSPILDAFSTVANQIKHGYGALAFSEAYDLLINEYEEQVEANASHPLDRLADSVEKRAAQAPYGPLSAEFYINSVLALILFSLSQISSKQSEERLLKSQSQSEERLLKRLDAMKPTISIQLDALLSNRQEGIFLVADRSVNLRTGPGPDHEKLDVLTRNQKVVQLETSDEWTKVEYFDYLANAHKRGWVHSRYFIALAQDND